MRNWNNFRTRQTPTDGLAQCKGLALPGDDHDNLSAIEHSRDANRQRHAWDHANVVVEETRVRKNRFESESLDAGPRRER